MTVKGCTGFSGMVKFLSLFCPELQKLLKPIYDLIRKGRQFIWEEEQQEAFDKIKRRLQSYIYQMIKADFIYTQIPVNLLEEVLYIRFKMVKQN